MVYRARWLRVWAAVLPVLVCTAVLAQGQGPREDPPGRQRGENKGGEVDVSSGTGNKDAWIPPGLSPEEQAEWKDGRPPGWSRGGKGGWKGGDRPPGLARKGGALPPGLADRTPPGWERWNDEKKKGWERALEEAKEKVRGAGRKPKGLSGRDLEMAVGSVEAAARTGVPVGHVLDLVERAMERGMGGRGIEAASRALAYGVGKDIDFGHVGEFVRQKLDEGLRDDALAIEIYKEIARRHAEHPNARKAIRQDGEKGGEN